MATVQKFLPMDNSSVANFILWCLGISNAIGSTMGWTQQNDTGQVVWTATVLTLTQVTVGANAVYSYSSYTGPAPRVGMSVIVTGFATGGNNVTGTLTAVSGGASGTVTMALTTQSNETHAGSGTTTAIASVPASAYVYEIWAPADALQTGSTQYFVKIEYGFATANMNTCFRISIGTGTNGAGTLTGTTTGPFTMNQGSGYSNQGATGYECNFSGDTGRMGMMLWRNVPFAGCAGAFFTERTLATDGTPNSDGVTLVMASSSALASAVTNIQTLSFVAGAGNNRGQLPVLTCELATAAFNNQIPLSPVFPEYGKFGNPMTVCGCCSVNDLGEGVLVQTTLYGATRTYIAAGAPAGSIGSRLSFTRLTGGASEFTKLLMRYD